MSHSSDGAFLETEHAVYLCRDVTRHVVGENVSEMRYGISDDLAFAFIVFNPMLFVVLEIHFVVEIQRGRPCEMLEQLDWHVDWRTVLDTVLNLVCPSRLEKEAVGHAGIVLSVNRIADVDFAVPVFFAFLAEILERIYAVHRERRLRQRYRHVVRQGVLAVTGVQGEVEQVREACLECDTRLESVAEMLSDRHSVVFVVIVTHDVDVGGER